MQFPGVSLARLFGANAGSTPATSIPTERRTMKKKHVNPQKLMVTRGGVIPKPKVRKRKKR